MAKKRNDLLAPASPLDGLFARVVAILEQARARVVRSVNSEMVLAYWHIGREIVEQDQGGRKRAAYGEAVLEALSRRLTTGFGRGFDVTNLRKMRQFFRMFEIRDAVRLESGKGKRDTARLVSGVEATRIMACDDLSWSHYRLLMQVDFYVDLVFYNYLLRCFVLVDLKVGKLTHQDIGQMDSYVRLFDAHARPPGDNPTIGLILCSRKNEAIAKYSVLRESKQIFAAKYVKILPTEAELQVELERERRLLDKRHLLDRKSAEKP